jgi:two-component system response regulator YesN
MLKVLIAEDDKLVRKGLIALMPWEQFGLQIAGEAVNGEAALQFLENHEVDLLITDLAMPVMSGIELMRAVRMRWPHIWLVVLTFHQDFEYVQEALRLGAIDYIVKTQLDKESMEDVLSRIVGRIREEAGKPLRAGRLLAAGKDQLQFQSHYGYALILPREDHEPPMSGADRRLSEDWLEIEQGLWLNIRDEAA